jgi:hypothetical protein
MTKTCSKCKETKDIADFYHHSQTKDGYHSMCKKCQRSSAKGTTIRLRARIKQYKADHPCIKCGESDPDILVFHHREPSEKDFKISAAGPGSKRGWDSIAAEIAKCDIMCHNCHIKMHYPDQTRKMGYRKNAKGEKVYPHARVKKWVYELKAGKACIICGETHNQCLDFHHRNPAEKLFGIKEGLQTSVGKAAILAEVEKCDILCSNCHTKYEINKGQAFSQGLRL